MAGNGYLILTDYNGNAYNFNGSFDIKSQKVSINSSVQKLLYAHGGREVADKYLKHRTIQIEGNLYASTEANFETAKIALEDAILKGGYLSISNDTVARRIEVSLIDYDPDILEYELHDKVTLAFVALSPFWEDTSLTTNTKAVTGNDSWTITITGCADDIMLPEIEIDASADLPGIKMYNLDDGGIPFEYVDAAFFNTDVLQIDSKLGTVKKNGNDSIIYFTKPYFLRLKKGANVIYYEGGAATIKVKYRKVYL